VPLLIQQSRWRRWSGTGWRFRPTSAQFRDWPSGGPCSPGVPGPRVQVPSSAIKGHHDDRSQYGPDPS
jgi:hypothetical protein